MFAYFQQDSTMASFTGALKIAQIMVQLAKYKRQVKPKLKSIWA